MSRARKRKKRGDAAGTPAPELTADSATRLDTLSPKQGWGLLLGLMGLIGVVVFWPYLIGQKLYIFTDIGSDTINAFVPRLVHLAQYWRETGIPSWSFNMGMGQNIYPNSLGNPYDLLLMVLGPEALPYFLGWLEVLKIGSAGCLMVAWLRLRGFDWVPCIYAGLGYAFCGSVIVGGGWYSFSTIAVYTALVPLGYELFRLRRRFLTFAIVVGVIASFNVFNLATMGLFGLAYFVVRALASKPDWKALGRETAILLGLSAIGVMLSAVFSLEAAAEILSSPRVGGEASKAASLTSTPMFALGDQRFYGTLILRTLSNDLLGSGSGFMGWYNYLEAPMNYSTLLALLLIPQAFVFLDKRRRIVFGIALVIILGMQVFSYFRYMFWFFSGNYFRTFSTFISWTYLALAVKALQEIGRQRRVNMPLLVGTAVVLLIGLLYPWSWTHRGAPVEINGGLRGFCTLIIVAEAGLIWALGTGRNRFAAQAGLLGVLVLELTVISYTPVNARDVVMPEQWETAGYNDATVQAISKIREQDDGFYRVHKYYHSSPAIHASVNDAQIQNFYGTSSYYSFNQPNYLRFLAGMGLIDMGNEAQSRWAQGVRGQHPLEVFASVKYFLLRTNQKPDAFLAVCEDLGTVGDVRIYKNRHFVGLGILYDRVFRESDFASLEVPQRQQALLQGVVLSDVVETEFPVESVAELLKEPLRPLQSLELDDHSQNAISGTVTAHSPQMVVFSIPLDAGWSAKVNGVAAEIQQVNFGLMAVSVPAGKHEIALSYSPPLLGKGLALSLFALCGMLGIGLARKLSRRMASFSSEKGAA